MIHHKFTEHERTVDSSTVPDSELVVLATRAARSYALRFKWRDGWRDLLPVLWEIYHALRARGLPSRYWTRAVGYAMIDYYRKFTKYRRFKGVHEVQFPEWNSAPESRAVECVMNSDHTVPARRETPDTFARAIAPYEDKYKRLTGRQKTVILHLFHGLTMYETAEAMGVSESRVSQLLAEVLAITGGEYAQGFFTTDAVLASHENARRAYREKKNKIPAAGVDLEPGRDYDSTTGSELLAESEPEG